VRVFLNREAMRVLFFLGEEGSSSHAACVRALSKLCVWREVYVQRGPTESEVITVWAQEGGEAAECVCEEATECCWKTSGQCQEEMSSGESVASCSWRNRAAMRESEARP
jgi:hypothetical protein